MRLHSRGWLTSLVLVLLLGACAPQAEILPLVSAPDPQGRFTFSIPAGWEVQSEGETSIYTPSGYAGSLEESRVLLFLSPTNTLDADQHIDTAEPMIQAFLGRYLDDTFEVISQDETKVDKHGAMVLNFAKPHNGTYILGRVVIVAMPGVVVIFLGSATQVEWQAFVATFEAMLDAFHLISIQTPTPMEP